jgi:hypothetical protein
MPREKFRVLRELSSHELSELDEDFNLSVLTDKKAYVVAVLTKKEFDSLTLSK